MPVEARALRIHMLTDRNERTKLFPDAFEFNKVIIILLFVLNFLSNALENANRSREIIHAASGTEGGLDDGGT